MPNDGNWPDVKLIKLIGPHKNEIINLEVNTFLLDFFHD